jgi:PucR family transcriptional regulator, purine catabolism regulatory protein
VIPTIRHLLNRHELGLRLLVPGGPDALTSPVSWIHSSDLVDPTPFLDASHVVLTTGTQFTAGSAADFERYVVRLHEHGVSGIGFGAGVAVAEAPAALVEVCQRAGMPLFEVPYRVPFIAVVRFAADLIAEAAHARETWSLATQRAISFAALRPDPLPSILRELSRGLGRSVGLFDARGRLTTSFGPTNAASPRQSPLPEQLTEEILRLLERGQRSSSTLVDGDEQTTVQTIGRRGALRGILATAGTGALDAADQTVITSAIALVGLSLEQNRSLKRARGQLRDGLLELLLEGQLPLVEGVTAQLGGELPAEPVRFLALSRESAGLDALVDDLETRYAESERLFFATQPDAVIVCSSVAAAAKLASDLIRRHQLSAGLSDPLPYSDAAAGVAQAKRALARATPGSLVAFRDVADRGIIGLVDSADSAAIAHSILQPVVAHDATNGTALLESARVWLENNGAWDPAAKQLGIHRHTLSRRVALIEQLTGRGLDSFEERANLWLALTALRD